MDGQFVKKIHLSNFSFVFIVPLKTRPVFWRCNVVLRRAIHLLHPRVDSLLLRRIEAKFVLVGWNVGVVWERVAVQIRDACNGGRRSRRAPEGIHVGNESPAGLGKPRSSDCRRNPVVICDGTKAMPVANKMVCSKFTCRVDEFVWSVQDRKGL